MASAIARTNPRTELELRTLGWPQLGFTLEPKSKWGNLVGVKALADLDATPFLLDPTESMRSVQ